MQRPEQSRVQAGGSEGRPFGQDRHRIVAVQALLMAGNDAEITDPRVAFQLTGKKTRGIFDNCLLYTSPSPRD